MLARWALWQMLRPITNCMQSIKPHMTACLASLPASLAGHVQDHSCDHLSNPPIHIQQLSLNQTTHQATRLNPTPLQPNHFKRHCKPYAKAVILEIAPKPGQAHTHHRRLPCCPSSVWRPLLVRHCCHLTAR